MNLYLLKQNTNPGYDTYDSCIVSAKNQEEAKKIYPSEYKRWSEEMNCFVFNYNDKSKTEEPDACNDWVTNLDDIYVYLIGTSDEDKGLVLSSFNAG